MNIKLEMYRVRRIARFGLWYLVALNILALLGLMAALAANGVFLAVPVLLVVMVMCVIIGLMVDRVPAGVKWRIENEEKEKARKEEAEKEAEERERKIEAVKNKREFWE